VESEDLTPLLCSHCSVAPLLCCSAVHNPYKATPGNPNDPKAPERLEFDRATKFGNYTDFTLQVRLHDGSKATDTVWSMESLSAPILGGTLTRVDQNTTSVDKFVPGKNGTIKDHVGVSAGRNTWGDVTKHQTYQVAYPGSDGKLHTYNLNPKLTQFSQVQAGHTTNYLWNGDTLLGAK
jgi:hypothetical protein